ncbi:MAG: SH3 domain-containing protein [Saccharofermentans sp.]|nr:SH3 domain-containing protein [Saccharofermentans sp.]
MKKRDIDNSSKHKDEGKGIRHLEGAASFLNEASDINGEYGQAQDMFDMWGLDNKEASVATRGRNTLLRFVVAVIVTAFIITSIFVILPQTLPELFKGSNIELFVEREVNLMYDDTYRVVNVAYSNILRRPNPSSARLTQVLYNEPVIFIEKADDRYSLVKTVDGIEGYMLTNDFTDDTSSIEPDLHEYMLVVSDTSKNVMTHASQGTLITQVMMNTVLYADVKRDGVYQVSLPGGESGWIGSSGVIEIAPRGAIEVVSSRYFVSSALSFVNATHMENGIVKQGMSMNGLIYVCSCVNGINMPRTIEEQMEMGNNVPLEYDAVTGELMIESIIPGDLVFIESNSGDYEAALCTDIGTLMMVSDARTTIRLRDFTADSEIASRIVCVRRVFSD